MLKSNRAGKFLLDVKVAAHYKRLLLQKLKVCFARNAQTANNLPVTSAKMTKL